MRKLKLTWVELCEILKKQGNDPRSFELLPDEEIKGITLTRPREVLIWTEKKVSK